MAKKDLILNSEGLKIDLSPKSLRWDLLKSSSLVNFKNNGWNSKSHWIEALTNILQWDFKSITRNTNLPQRIGKTFFEDRCNKECSSITAGHTTEPALERGIYNTYGIINNNGPKKLTIGKEKYQIITYQLPLAANQDSKFKSIDLFGHTDNTKVIIELKAGKNESDSPLYAIFESMVYYSALRKNKKFNKKLQKRLKEYSIKEDNPENMKYKILIMAPSEYWRHWCKKPEIYSQLNKLIEKISHDPLAIELIEIEKCSLNKKDCNHGKFDYTLKPDVKFKKLT